MADFAARVIALEEKLAPKPHTPSAAQGFLKPMSQRRKSGKKSGGQQGHEGQTLKRCETPDKFEQHHPEKCHGCGLNLNEFTGEVAETRQVVDLPEIIRFQTVEHQALEVCCPNCQRRVKATFPPDVNAPVQYGPNIQATCTLLKLDQAISLERIVAFCTDWFGQSPSEGTLQNWIGEAHRRLEPVEEWIREGIIAAPCAGFDETMVRSAKKNAWIHVARTERLTHFSSPGGRGKIAMEKAGILPHFHGVAYHDAWSAYFGFTDCEHGLCCAHLLREGAALKERFDPKGKWTEPILAWLLSVKAKRDVGVFSSRGILLKQLRSRLSKGYRTLGLSPPCPGVKLSPCGKELRSRVRWLDRLYFYADEVIRFGWDALTPFDNNGSERDIRPVKLFSKVFGCWRSLSGLESFCRVRGYLSTLRKQGISPREGLLSIFRGQPILPAIA
jgi:transposase